MDEMNIRSSLLKRVICKYIEKALKKKFGCEVSIKLDDISFKMDDKVASIDLGMHAEAKREDVKNILEELV